jgi:hypothetical protein
MLCAEADPEREGDEQKTAENISDGGWEDAPAERKAPSGTDPHSRGDGKVRHIRRATGGQ